MPEGSWQYPLLTYGEDSYVRAPQASPKSSQKQVRVAPQALAMVVIQDSSPKSRQFTLTVGRIFKTHVNFVSYSIKYTVLFLVKL